MTPARVTKTIDEGFKSRNNAPIREPAEMTQFKSQWTITIFKFESPRPRYTLMMNTKIRRIPAIRVSIGVFKRIDL
jgi:hypothetical protein